MMYDDATQPDPFFDMTDYPLEPDLAPAPEPYDPDLYDNYAGQQTTYLPGDDTGGDIYGAIMQDSTESATPASHLSGLAPPPEASAQSLIGTYLHETVPSGFANTPVGQVHSPGVTQFDAKGLAEAVVSRASAQPNLFAATLNSLPEDLRPQFANAIMGQLENHPEHSLHSLLANNVYDAPLLGDAKQAVWNMSDALQSAGRNEDVAGLRQEFSHGYGIDWQAHDEHLAAESDVRLGEYGEQAAKAVMTGSGLALSAMGGGVPGAVIGASSAVANNMAFSIASGRPFDLEGNAANLASNLAVSLAANALHLPNDSITQAAVQGVLTSQVQTALEVTLREAISAAESGKFDQKHFEEQLNERLLDASNIAANAVTGVMGGITAHAGSFGDVTNFDPILPAPNVPNTPEPPPNTAGEANGGLLVTPPDPPVSMPPPDLPAPTPPPDPPVVILDSPRSEVL